MAKKKNKKAKASNTEIQKLEDAAKMALGDGDTSPNLLNPLDLKEPNLETKPNFSQINDANWNDKGVKKFSQDEKNFTKNSIKKDVRAKTQNILKQNRGR